MKECPTSYCSHGLMQAQCTQIGKCDWLDLSSGVGTQSYVTDFTQHPRLITNYYYHENADFDCLPCCVISSNDPRVPSKISLNALP